MDTPQKTSVEAGAEQTASNTDDAARAAALADSQTTDASSINSEDYWFLKLNQNNP